jgi:hypothetical protein
LSSFDGFVKSTSSVIGVRENLGWATSLPHGRRFG